MDIQTVKQMLQYGEKANMECKKAATSVPKSVWDTYSSMANTNGGYIFLGVYEDMDNPNVAHRFTIKGVENAAKVVTDFWNTLQGDKVNSNILVDSDVEIINDGDNDIISIHIPRADYKHRPIFLNGNPYKGSFKRNHEGDYHCSEEEVRAMIRDQNEEGNDSMIVEYYTMDDIDKETLLSYRREFSIKNPNHVWSQLPDKDFIENLGGYRKDRRTGKEGLTLAGLLMFGKGLAIRDRFDNVFMDYRDESNVTDEIRWNDRITYDGTWENNLYNFFKKVIPKLTSDLKKPFRLEGITRVDDTPVHKAVREAFVNAIIHMDYLLNGTLKVIKRADGFEFSNPGLLKLPKEEIYKGGNSKARNPRMQTMLRFIGFGDNAGSGFPTILKTWKNENWRKPDLVENEDLQQVDLKLWMVSIMPDECIERLQIIFGEDYKTLNGAEQLSLATALLEGSINNSRIQEITEIHRTDIGIMLAGLVQKEMLIPDGYGRGMTYKINEDYLARQDVSQNGDQGGGQDDDQTIYNKFEALNNDDMELKIIKLIEDNNKITQQQIADVLKCGKRTIERTMSKMKNINYKGSGYSGHWEIDRN